MVENHLRFLSLLLVLVTSTNPGIIIGANQDSMTNFKDEVLPVILREVATITLKDVTKELGNGFLKVVVSVTKIRCTGVSLDTENTGVTLTPPDSLTVQAAGFTGKMTFTWSYTSPLGGDSGEGFIQLLPSSINSVIKVSQISGKPIISVTSISFKISDLQITISNSPISTVANWLLTVFKDTILADLTQVLNQYTGQIITNVVNQILSQYTALLNVTETIAINYTLTSDPVITSQYAQVNLVGTFVDLTHPNEIMDVAPAAAMPSFSLQEKAIQLYLSEYTLNTGLYAGMTSDTFQGQVTPATPGVGNYLNSKVLNATFPGIAEKYPNQAFSMNCAASEPAPLFIASAGATPETGSLTGNFTLDCGLLTMSTPVTQVIRVELQATFETDVYVQNWVLNMTLENVAVTSVNTHDSTLPLPVNDVGLADFMNALVGFLAPAALNAFIGSGLPLPQINNVDMSNSTMTIEDGYLAFLVTPVYNFTTLRSRQYCESLVTE